LIFEVVQSFYFGCKSLKQLHRKAKDRQSFLASKSIGINLSFLALVQIEMSSFEG